MIELWNLFWLLVCAFTFGVIVGEIEMRNNSLRKEVESAKTCV